MFDVLYTKERLQVEGVLTPSSFASHTGVSLKPAHYQSILSQLPNVGFFEIHAENYLSKGGPARHYLHLIAQHYPITIHGVGLSIGGESPLNSFHLDRVAGLVEEMNPVIFSEHLAWSSHDDVFLNDLLPVAYNLETLTRVCQHIEQLQNRLKRQVLIENPSTYFQFVRSDMTEIDFLLEMSKRTGCGLLLDVNNVEVSCFNNGSNPYDYINAFPMDAVAQLHLAGHTTDVNSPFPLKIDSHDEIIDSKVWDLYRHTLTCLGDCPTLIERDGNIPALAELLKEAHYADAIRSSVKVAQLSKTRGSL